jgi:hypothetical protein
VSYFASQRSWNEPLLAVAVKYDNVSAVHILLGAGISPLKEQTASEGFFNNQEFDCSCSANREFGIFITHEAPV